MSNSSVFKVHLKVLRSTADRQLYDREFQIEGALMLNAFANNAETFLVQKTTVCLTIAMCMLVGCPVWAETGKLWCRWFGSCKWWLLVCFSRHTTVLLSVQGAVDDHQQIDFQFMSPQCTSLSVACGLPMRNHNNNNNRQWSLQLKADQLRTSKNNG